MRRRPPVIRLIWMRRFAGGEAGGESFTLTVLISKV